MQTNVVAVALKSWFAIVGTKPSPCYCSPPEWHKKIPRFPEETGEGAALRQQLLVLDVLVDGLGGSLAGTHGLDDGSGTGHGIAAGVHAVTAGLAVVAVGDDMN